MSPSDVRATMRRLEDLAGQGAELEGRLGQLGEELGAARAELLSLQAQLEATAGKEGAERQRREGLSRSVERARVLLRELGVPAPEAESRASLEGAENRLRELDKAIDQATSAQRLGRSLGSRLDALPPAAGVQAAVAELGRLRTEAGERQRRLHQLAERRRALQQQHAPVRESIASCQERSAALREEHGPQIDELRATRDRCRGLQDDVQRLEKELAEATARIEELKRRKAREVWPQELQRLQQERDRLTADLEALAATLRDRQAAVAARREELTSAEQAAEAATGELARLQQVSASLGQQAREKNEAIDLPGIATEDPGATGRRLAQARQYVRDTVQPEDARRRRRSRQ